jgi:predicted CXXCH cytochrome family protein
MTISVRSIKLVLLGLFSLLVLVWALPGLDRSAASNETLEEVPIPAHATADDYVGSETCQACHEDQFKNFAGTKHAKLKEVGSWKDKVQGCESCHGPGKLHVEDPTSPAGRAAVTFKDKNSKQISETCLACHTGKESHNNFRRGEHWRNDLGCTDCHSPHGNGGMEKKADSITFAALNGKPAHAVPAMLKMSEPNLCISCHNETRAQFKKPFHHKVLEGTMKCSDCHNPHGGFEAKQTKLAVGADASCIKCHSDKQGPFAFEHAPLKTEGCASCHTPHGSSNPKLLRRSSVKQLCMECHTTLSDADPGAPQAPHDLRTARYNNCTVCHARIHGSNTHKFFFR